MRGIVFTEFLQFLEKEGGYPLVTKVVAHTNKSLKNTSFTSVEFYDFSDLQVLISSAAAALSVKECDILGSYGKFLFGRLAAKMPMHIEGIKGWRELLAGLDSIVHDSIVKLRPDKPIPSTLTVIQDKPSLLRLHYCSPRGLADLAEGLISGCITHYEPNLMFEIHRRDIACDGTSTIFDIILR